MLFKKIQNLQILSMRSYGESNTHKMTPIEIESFLRDLKCKIHVIVISETWVKENEKSLFNISNYKSIYSCRKNRNGGGIGIFIHDDIN
jgi:hypothetical protein